MDMVQRHRAPRHVIPALKLVDGQIRLDRADPVIKPGGLDALASDLHHPARRVSHEHGADAIGEQDAQSARATTHVECLHPWVELYGLLDRPGHGELALLVARVVVPRRRFVVESRVFLHALDPSAATRV